MSLRKIVEKLHIVSVFLKNLRMFQGQLQLKEILDPFQNDRLMEPLSKLETLVNV